jgi:predicted nucleic acid-binding protein
VQRVTIDTNVFIRHDPAGFPAGFFMSAVVVQELTAGAKDAAAVRAYDHMWKWYEAAGLLLVPTGEDWWIAGKVLNSLLRGLRSHKRGRIPAISKEEQQRLLRDVLIARTARRVNAGVVTENVADFKKIKNFCDVRIIRPAEYLGILDIR